MKIKSGLFTAWSVAALIIGGCKPATMVDDTGVDTANAPGVLHGACQQSINYGGFEVAMVEADGYTAVSGAISDGVVPITILEQVGQDGDWVLLRRNNPFCNPPCAANEACDHDGNCIPYPKDLNLGMVTLSGLALPVSMNPAQPGNRYFFTQLPHPGFQPGVEITLKSTGGSISPITLNGIGIEPIQVLTEEMVLVEGQDLKIRWTPPTVKTEARVLINFTIDQHGNSPVTMRGDVADVGSATISGVLISQFIGFGVSGFPSVDIFRCTVDRVSVKPPGKPPGCVEFRVFSRRSYTVKVANHTPCKSQNDCGEGEVCDPKTETCKPVTPNPGG